jgi:lipid A 3-O-deacylase
MDLSKPASQEELHCAFARGAGQSENVLARTVQAEATLVGGTRSTATIFHQNCKTGRTSRPMGTFITPALRGIVPVLIALLLAMAPYPGKVLAEASPPDEIPIRYGAGGTFGYAFNIDDDTVLFSQAVGFALFDLQTLWRHAALDPLRFKVEFSAGSTLNPDNRFMASAGILALYYLDWFAVGSFRPYFEGGGGAIFTDFRVDGQAYRFNFNPQVGVGTEFKARSDLSCFTAVRLHHISNAGLNDDNRGINSIVFMLGLYF